MIMVQDLSALQLLIFVILATLTGCLGGVIITTTIEEWRDRVESRL